jgi:hypothetical protein
MITIPNVIYFIHRAPVMVAIALVEHGFDSMSAVTFIREKRLVHIIIYIKFYLFDVGYHVH